ncbi:MAG TPA: amidohydrolase family protein, partial [Longimicrobiales bacterium]|nr:amidohydrolase family protein [Longimicrobiales bacterium]
LKTGVIDMIVSDHSPCPPVMKQLDSGDFLAAWGGIASLQLGLRAVWTAAGHRGFSLEQVTKWMCSAPATLASMANRKGTIAAGCDADIVAFEPDVVEIVNAEALEHRHKLTPYDGMQLRGRVQTTYVRGNAVYDQGEFTEPTGRLLRK